MIDQLKKEYIEWMTKEIQLEEFNNFIEITTPFVDMHHDNISLFLVNNQGKYKLTDDGYLVDELHSLGIIIKKSKKRNNYFKSTLKVFGINYNDITNELFINFSDTKEFPEMQQRLIQCVIRVSDMMMTSHNRVASLFKEDVSNYLLDNDLGISENVGFVGKTGQNQIFDFALPKKRNVSPKLIQTVNNPETNAYKAPLVSFFDVQDTKMDHDFIVIANDVTNNLSNDFIRSLTNHDINVLNWSNKEGWIDSLKSS